MTCPMTFIDLCHKFFSVPTPFLSLGQKSHRKANIARAFRAWTSSCKWRKWWSRLTNCKLKTNLPFIACHLQYVISIHFNCLSPGNFILLQPLNHVNPLIGRKMPHSKTSTEAPYTSAGRASVGWPDGMDHRRQNPWAHPQENDTQTWPLNQPSSKHKQTSFELSLHQGDGGWKPCCSDQIILKLILPKMLNVDVNHPAKQDRKKTRHAQPCSILEARNCSQNWDIDTNSIAV